MLTLAGATVMDRRGGDDAVTDIVGGIPQVSSTYTIHLTT